MKRRLITTVVASAAMVVGFATPALAHHNTVAVSAVCNQQTGEFDVTWGVTNSETDKSETITASTRSSAIAVGTTISDGGTFTSTEHFPGDSTETLSLQVSAKWENGNTNTSNTASVTLAGDCEKPDQPVEIVPAVRVDGDCDSPDKVTLPEQPEGLDHTVTGSLVGPGHVEIDFFAIEGYFIPAGTQTHFEFDLLGARDCRQEVTPIAPAVSISTDCDVEGQVSVTLHEGLIWKLDGVVITSSPLEGPISGTITVDAAEGYKLSEGSQTSFPIDVPAAEECAEPETPEPKPEDESPSDEPAVLASAPLRVSAPLPESAPLPVTGSSTLAGQGIGGIALIVVGLLMLLGVKVVGDERFRRSTKGSQ